MSEKPKVVLNTDQELNPVAAAFQKAQSAFSALKNAYFEFLKGYDLQFFNGVDLQDVTEDMRILADLQKGFERGRTSFLLDSLPDSDDEIPF